MWYIAAALAGIAAAGAFAGVVRTRSQGEDPLPASADSLKKLSLEEINILLARLQREEPPEVIHGAMCYRVAGPPSVAEYTCPECGEKTIYDNHQTAFVEFQLNTARRLAESINSSTEFQVILDETRFCAFCSGDTAEEARLELRVLTPEGEEVLNAVNLTDLRMLDSFLKGNLYWLNETDARMPLKDHIGRMRMLLGLSEE